MNILVDLVNKVVNYFVPQPETILRYFVPQPETILRYLQNYDANFQKLKDDMQKLKDDRMSIQRKVSEAENNLETIDEKVKHWLDKATNIIDEADKVIKDEETTNDQCFNGLCPNLVARYQFSERAETKAKDLVAIREEAPKDDRISYPTISEEIWLKSHKNYETFESRLSTLKSIRSALTDPNVSIIGVYGMGGTGKSTIVKEVAKQAKQDILFDQVVFSEVSQTIDVKKIQEEIANKLGLVLHEEAEAKRANRLYDRLKMENKILIVLDNIWNHVDLESIGIPCGEDHKGCKILLTARDLNVLLRMDSNDNFLISTLCVEEAWKLFKTKAGDDIEKSALKSTATDVVKACGGLPIALVTIGKALRRKSVPEWKNALRELQKPSTANFEGVPTEAYKSIELSYRYLKDEQLKQTFLLYGLTGISSIKDLFKYCVGMSLFQRVNKIEDAHDKLYALIHELIDSCLLLEGSSSEGFSMHDVVRDVAIIIACREKNAFVVRNEDVWEWPDVDALKKCGAIHLIDVSIHQLLERLDCPQLEFLYITSKSFLEINIPPDFFIGMRSLRVVDFTRMRLFSLPSSIEFLVNLQTLCLDQGKLGDIAIIGKLKNLEVLSLWGSDILQLPEELGQLTKLRLLDLTNCFKLKVIAPIVLSSLTRLEELYMGNCFIEWEVDGPNGERSNASLAELMHLSRLTTLEINVKNDNNLPKDFFKGKLNRFKISIGDISLSTPLKTKDRVISRSSMAEFLIAKRETLRTLKLKLNSTTIFSKNLQGIKNVEYLCLDNLQGVKNVLYELDTEGFSQLKHLHVQNNPDFKCLVEVTESVPFEPFPLLESLTLDNLIQLERTCQDQLRVHSFNELRSIIVKQCHSLSNVFLLSTASYLPRLQRIAVIDCRSMNGLFAVGGENDAIEKIEFPQLSTLCLGHLPKLISFCCEVKTPNTRVSHQESIEITCSNEISLEDNICPSTTFFNDKVVLPNLQTLEMNGINVENIWHNQLPIMFPHFQNLTRLVAYGCHKLRYIFLASMVQTFEQLQYLKIEYCMGLREIISEEGADQVTPCFVFPRLTTLNLWNLHELRCLYPGMHTFECPALKRLNVFGCEQVKLFDSESFSLERSNENYQLEIPAQPPLFLFEKVFSNLENLGVDGEGIRMILQGDFPQHLFDRLKFLNVYRGKSASFPLELLERFHNLEELFFQYNSYKEILSNGGPMDKHTTGKLARIKRLSLYNLDDLEQLWKQLSGLDSIFQYLETLLAEHCPNLSILLPPSSVSFQNITKLQVFGCKGLKNLVTSSTAKGLVELVTMKLFGCSAMTEVIKSEGNDASKEDIVFSKLKTLILYDLRSLKSFCSGDHMFTFPSLKELYVIGCPNMSTFTIGELSTPPRVDVWCSEEKEKFNHWEGDLNTTIQNLHKSKLLEGSSSFSTQY